MIWSITPQNFPPAAGYFPLISMCLHCINPIFFRLRRAISLSFQRLCDVETGKILRLRRARLNCFSTFCKGKIALVSPLKAKKSPAALYVEFLGVNSAPQARKFWGFQVRKVAFLRAKQSAAGENFGHFGANRVRELNKPPLVKSQIEEKGGVYYHNYH